MSYQDPFEPLLGPGRTGGAANQRPDEAPQDTRPANTLLHYKYRDASNYKVGATVVLAGRYENEDLRVIQAKLQDGDGFIPSQVGLANLQPSLQQYDSDSSLDEYGVNEDDHAWHELDLPSDVSRTDDEPTTDLTWPQLVENFRTVEWDESAVDLSR